MAKTFSQLKKGDLVYIMNKATGSVKVKPMERIGTFEMLLSNGGSYNVVEIGNDCNYSKVVECSKRNSYDDDVVYSDVYYSDKDECMKDVDIIEKYNHDVAVISRKVLRTGKNYPKPKEPELGIYYMHDYPEDDWYDEED